MGHKQRITLGWYNISQQALCLSLILNIVYLKLIDRIYLIDFEWAKNVFFWIVSSNNRPTHVLPSLFTTQDPSLTWVTLSKNMPAMWNIKTTSLCYIECEFKSGRYSQLFPNVVWQNQYFQWNVEGQFLAVSESWPLFLVVAYSSTLLVSTVCITLCLEG